MAVEQLLDHIIVGWNNPKHFSFLAEKLMENGKVASAGKCAERENELAQRISRRH